MSHQDNPVGSVGTSFAIIECLKENDDGFTNIPRGIGVTKSTVFNHVLTLEDNDVRIRDGDTTDSASSSSTTASTSVGTSTSSEWGNHSSTISPRRPARWPTS